MSSTTEKQVQPKSSSVVDHLLFFNHSRKAFTRTERETVNNETRCV